MPLCSAGPGRCRRMQAGTRPRSRAYHAPPCPGSPLLASRADLPAPPPSMGPPIPSYSRARRGTRCLRRACWGRRCRSTTRSPSAASRAGSGCCLWPTSCRQVVVGGAAGADATPQAARQEVEGSRQLRWDWEAAAGDCAALDGCCGMVPITARGQMFNSTTPTRPRLHPRPGSLRPVPPLTCARLPLSRGWPAPAPAPAPRPPPRAAMALVGLRLRRLTLSNLATGNCFSNQG